MRNTPRYPDRLPSPQRKAQPDEHYREQVLASHLHQQESTAPLMAPDSLFFANTTAYMPNNDPPTDAAPPPDWHSLHQALHEQIASHSDEDCAFTLMLPVAGEVDVMLTRCQPAGWDIALRFSPRVWQHWHRREIQCRRQLSLSLAAPVRLKIEQGYT
ncbi:type III secretion system HrpP C-terminal domain-containing protein [Pantoea stewartii]|uniref:type III secretion system HrpP C-terminal domain-containing protein n=1 Tax=Pantoea stewartii TaxID=66269 RepID=UPI00345BFCE3